MKLTQKQINNILESCDYEPFLTIDGWEDIHWSECNAQLVQKMVSHGILELHEAFNFDADTETFTHKIDIQLPHTWGEMALLIEERTGAVLVEENIGVFNLTPNQ